MDIDKTNPYWSNWFTIRWGNLKIKVQMLDMQDYDIGLIDCPYNQYQYMFPGLALWHLHFNYLKRI